MNRRQSFYYKRYNCSNRYLHKRKETFTEGNVCLSPSIHTDSSQSLQLFLCKTHSGCISCSHHFNIQESAVPGCVRTVFSAGHARKSLQTSFFTMKSFAFTRMRGPYSNTNFLHCSNIYTTLVKMRRTPTKETEGNTTRQGC